MSNDKNFPLDNKNSRLALLVHKQMQGELTPEEELEIGLLFESSPEIKEYFEFLLSTHAIEQLIQYERNNPAISKNLFTNNDGIHDNKYERIKKLLLYAKAAGIVLAVTMVVYLIVKTHRYDPDPGPGPDMHVVFTMVDGVPILLDTIQSYVLKEQGNFLVLLHHNEVRYMPHPDEETGDKKTGFNEIRIPAGRLFKVTLPDQSKVFLNAGSSVRMPVSGTGELIRSLELSGEGYFDVQPVYRGKNKFPFIVRAKAAAGLNQEITVLGTKFNVNAYGNAFVIKTTLEEGAIKVTGNGKTVFMSAGEELQTGIDFSRKIKDSKIDNTIAWKDGYFSYSNALMSDIIQDLERWYGVQVKLEEDITSRITMVEIPRSSDLKSILSTLCIAIECEFEIIDKQIRIVKHR